jgi:Mg-chelatase subunit ChlD
VDVVFVLDRSGSIELRNFDTIKRFLVELVDELDVEGGLVRIGVLVFSDNATVEFPLGTHSNRGAVINAINAITYPGGRTNTGEAMMMLRTVMFNATYNSAAPDVALIITDGESGDQNYTLREAMLAMMPAFI